MKRKVLRKVASQKWANNPRNILAEVATEPTDSWDIASRQLCLHQLIGRKLVVIQKTGCDSSFVVMPVDAYHTRVQNSVEVDCNVH